MISEAVMKPAGIFSGNQCFAVDALGVIRSGTGGTRVVPSGTNYFASFPRDALTAAGFDPVRVLDDFHEVLAGTRDHCVISFPTLSHGQRRWIEVTVTAARGGGISAIIVHRDVSEAMLAMDELRIAEVTFESRLGVMITDPSHVITRVNRAFCEITGYPAAEAIGKKPLFLRSGWHDAAFYQEMWTRIETTGSWHGEVWSRRKNGTVYPEYLSITPIYDNGQLVNYVASFSDISASKAAQDEIKHLAFSDALTHLPNRRLLFDRLGQAQATSVMTQQHGALILIDLDHFKRLNDSSGHAMGDFLLQQAADRLKACLRMGDTLARLGGDEFVVMLANLDCTALTAAAEAELVGKKLLANLAHPFDLSGLEHCLTGSMGIVLFKAAQDSRGDLLKRAEVAMYQAKAAGRNALRFYDTKMQSALITQVTLDADMRDALHRGEFFLTYQAQVDKDGMLLGSEALVRWRHPQHGIVSPAIFIPRAEENGMILSLGHWVLQESCEQLARWSVNPETRHLTVAVNVSSVQFRQPDFVDQILATIEATRANPNLLKLELTESLLIENIATVIEKMSALRRIGIHFSLDDFGTGYSSLSYLKQLPFSQLKIDQCFVADVLHDPNDAAIVHTIIELGRSFGLAVIAEGVETDAQRGFLAQIGCGAFQGYLYGKPDSAAALLEIGHSATVSQEGHRPV